MFTTDQIKDFIEKPFAFIERTGLRAILLAPRHVKLSIPLEGNGNHIGIMYAGALFTLAEIPGGALYLTTFDITRFYPVVKEMSIRFLKPVSTDAFIEMTLSEGAAGRIAAEAEENGKAEFILDGEIKDANNQLAATSHGVYQLRRQGT
jgi:acyl-coenzyme A thioesterase PaaI-like protein